MALDLYAGIPVADYEAARAWYEKLLGGPPTFVATPTEAVWELAERRSVVIEERPEHAGHAMHSIFVLGSSTRTWCPRVARVERSAPEAADLRTAAALADTRRGMSVPPAAGTRPAGGAMCPFRSRLRRAGPSV